MVVCMHTSGGGECLHMWCGHFAGQSHADTKGGRGSCRAAFFARASAFKELPVSPLAASRAKARARRDPDEAPPFFREAASGDLKPRPASRKVLCNISDCKAKKARRESRPHEIRPRAITLGHLVIVLLCALLAPATGVRGATIGKAELTAQIRHALAPRVTSEGPGAIVVVARDGVLVAEGALGYADVERKIPISDDTVFDLASCSKQFTAMGIMILADRGKLTLNDDARQFLPELAVRQPPIRICDLLHMTSGLSDYEKLLDDLEEKTNLDVLHAVAARPLLFATGSKFNYCDTNYVLLATIIERVSGRSLAQFLQAEIFDSAGMKQSVVLEAPGQSIAHRAEGYARDKHGAIKPSREDTRTYGDGQVMTTARDLVKWDAALRGNTLVKPQTLALAFTSGTLSDGKPCGYGFGWFVSEKNGRTVEHGGKWSGTSTYILRSLDRGTTVIVLSNLEQFPARQVAADIAALAE